jgi:hypothetical protein
VTRVCLGSAAALALLLPATAHAYRPFDSTDAAVADRGALELELGPLGYLAEGPDRALVAPSLVVNWGFAERWELVLEGRHLVALGAEPEGPRLRVEDTALSAKRVLREGSLQDRPGPSVATELGLLLPTVNGEPGMGAEGALILSQRWPDLTAHLNVGVVWTRAHEAGLLAGVILEGHDAWPVRPVAELLLEAVRDRPTAVSGLVGAIWRVREALSLDLAVRRARAGNVDTTELRAGLTWAIELGFPR